MSKVPARAPPPFFPPTARFVVFRSGEPLNVSPMESSTTRCATATVDETCRYGLRSIPTKSCDFAGLRYMSNVPLGALTFQAAALS